MPNVEERLYSRLVRRSNGCLEWTGGGHKGYGTIRFEGKVVLTHRLAWFLAYGEWPKDCLLHECDNPPCCDPEHLFEGTRADNARDRMRKGRNADQTRTMCRASLHPLTEENIYITPEGNRRCRECRRERDRERRRRRHAA